jgi:hypothetical protein
MDRTSGQLQAELILLRSIEVNDFFSTSDIWFMFYKYKSIRLVLEACPCIFSLQSEKNSIFLA